MVGDERIVCGNKNPTGWCKVWYEVKMFAICVLVLFGMILLERLGELLSKALGG